jgi:hypothetical protein
MHATATQQLYSKLPSHIYCTDDYRHGGKQMSKEFGILKNYIQVNTPTYQQAILLDHDDEAFMADLRYEHSHLPMPNIVIENKGNGRAHSITLLRSPVPKTEKSHKHPIAYCKAVEKALTLEYDADPYYNHIWVKNPFSDAYRVHVLRDEPYDLGELADKLEIRDIPITAKEVKAELALQRKRAESEGIFLGRNCHLFDMVRHWAYQEIRNYRGTDLELWRSAVMQEVMVQNAMLNSPLDFNELKGIAKSIARWVWNKDGQAQARFSNVQAHRGKLGDSSPGGKARSAQFDPKREQAKALHMQGMKKTKIAEFLGVSRMAVHRWLNEKV